MSNIIPGLRSRDTSGFKLARPIAPAIDRRQAGLDYLEAKIDLVVADPETQLFRP